jgi:hypothetical protein
MAIITTGNNFGATDAVTNTKLNNIANAATFDDPADETSLEKSTSGSDSGKLRIKDAGVTTDKLATSSSKTTGVTFAKMQHISTAKVLGRVSASEGDVEEAFDFKDEDNMSSNSATALASQQSIKAYADAAPKAQMKVNDVAGASVASDTESVTLPNGLIMKFGIVNASTSGTSVSFDDNFPNGVIAAYACPNSGDTLTQSTGVNGKAAVDTLTTSGMNVSCNGSAYWQAIGR